MRSPPDVALRSWNGPTAEINSVVRACTAAEAPCSGGKAALGPRSGAGHLEFAPLFLSVALYGAVGGLSVLSGGGPPGAVLVAQFATAVSCAMWVTRDARRHHRVPFFDFGTLVFFTYWLAVPLYLVWSRGWMGAILAAALFALMMGASIVATIAGGIARLV